MDVESDLLKTNVEAVDADLGHQAADPDPDLDPVVAPGLVPDPGKKLFSFVNF